MPRIRRSRLGGVHGTFSRSTPFEHSDPVLRDDADRIVVMRPYQLARLTDPARRDLHKPTGGWVDRGGGYVWHTTGSARRYVVQDRPVGDEAPHIDKGVDRLRPQGSDYQRCGDDRFEKGAATPNTSTRVLKRQLGPGARSSSHDQNRPGSSLRTPSTRSTPGTCDHSIMPPPSS
jgi:hypothetical protein